MNMNAVAKMKNGPTPEMMNLSDRETIIFNKLTSGEDCSAEDFDKLLVEAELAVKDIGSIIMIAKYLAAKVAPHGYIIKRVSGLGRGRKAVFCMAKKF